MKPGSKGKPNQSERNAEQRPEQRATGITERCCDEKQNRWQQATTRSRTEKGTSAPGSFPRLTLWRLVLWQWLHRKEG